MEDSNVLGFPRLNTQDRIGQIIDQCTGPRSLRARVSYDNGHCLRAQ